MSISVARATMVGRSQQTSVRQSTASASCGNTPMVPSRMLCLSCTLPAGETQEDIHQLKHSLLVMKIGVMKARLIVNWRKIMLKISLVTAQRALL